MTTLEKTLAEIKGRCGAATEGPWMSYPWSKPPTLPEDSDLKWLRLESMDKGLIIGWLWCDKSEQETHECNATFVERARQDIPMLLEILDIFVGSQGNCCDDILKDIENIIERHR